MERNTVQRQIILDTLKKLNSHPAIEEVYAEINKNHPAISKTTIYRNLRQLAESGSIRQVTMPDGIERYDCLARLHQHFRCKKCGGIYDLDIECPADMNKSIKKKYGFDVEKYDIIFSGVCEICKNQEPL